MEDEVKMKIEYIIKKIIIGIFFFIEAISLITTTIFIQGMGIIPSSYNSVYYFLYVLTIYVSFRTVVYIYQVIKAFELKEIMVKEYLDNLDKKGKIIKRIASNINIIVMTYIGFFLFKINEVYSWDKNILLLFGITVFMFLISLISLAVNIKKYQKLKKNL